MGLGAIEVLEPRTLLSVTAEAYAFNALGDTPLQVPAPGLLAADTSSTGHALTVASFTQPQHGTITVNPNGSFTYTPAANYAGADTFSYTATDGSTSASAAVSLTVTACTPEACVFAGPRLASVNSTQGPLLNAVLGGLLGTSLNLTAVDWTGLANASLSGTSLIHDIQTNLNLASPAQVLSTNITLTQLFTAAAQVAQADGNTAEVNALNALLADVGPITGTIQLGDLLQGTLNQGNLANVNFNTLDLVTGAIQLFNFRNVATTPAPITISGAELSALGLPATVGSLNLYAQVVEPPIFTCGPAGTQFHTAAIRLKFDLNNLIGLNLDTSSLLGAISSALGVPSGLLTVKASVNDVAVYVEVASASGTIQMINAVSGAVTVQAVPSLANVYIGQIADSVFFNRTHIINPATDLTFGDVGTLSISALGVINTSAGIQLRDYALGQAPASPTTLTFDPPYPAPAQTVGSSTTFITNLANQLTTNLQVQLNGNLGALLNPIVNTLAGDLVTPLVTGVITPVVAPVLSDVADPLLHTLGIGIGEAVVDVDGTGMICPPLANNDYTTTPENAPVTIPVLNNDAQEPGDTVTIPGTTQPAHGTDVVNSDGTITYTPAPGYTGPDTFTYTVTDGTGTPTTATVTVDVTPVAPVANNDAYSTPEGATLTVNAPGVQSNDTNPAGGTLTSTVVTQPAHGTVTLNPNGSFTYVPSPGYVGTDSFTYDDSNGTSTSNTAIVTLKVTATPPPVAENDTYATTEGTTLTVAAPGVLANDSSPSGRALTPIVLTQPAHGTLTFHPDGSFTYVPDGGFTGADAFTYDDSDGNNTSNTATVTLDVNPSNNQAPTAENDAYATPEGTTLTVAAPGVLANDLSPSGKPLTSTVVANPSHGTLTFNADGSLTYVPNAGYVGADSFTYRDSDGTNTSNTATVALDVTATPPPVANNDSYSATEGTTLTIAAPGVLTNDASPSGRPLTAVVVANPAHGALTFNANGSFSYVPNAGFTGTDSFTYRDTDGNNPSNVATVTLTVSPAANEAPGAVDDTYSTPEGTTLTVAAPGVQANDSNPAGGTMTSTVVAQPAHGSLTFHPDGSFTYVPDAGYVGSDSFTYQDTNSGGTSNPATVVLNVTAPAAPVANGDVYSTPEGTTLNVAAPGVQANDTNPAGGTLTSQIVTQPAHGTLTLNPNGSLTYVPDAGYVGSDSFTYDDTNGSATSNTATVTLNVTATPPPVANNDAYSTPEGTSLTVGAPGVLGNDTSPSGRPITAAVVASPAHGTLTFNANGSFTYVPNAGFVGSDGFTYDDSDGNNTSNMATVVLNVTPTAPPIANNDAYSTPEGTTLTVAAPGVLANDVSPTGKTLTPSVVNQPAHGTLTFNANGSFTYVPNAGYVGSDSFTYDDSDGNNTSNTATVTLDVTAASNQSPVANDDAYSTAEGTTLTIAAPGVLTNDTSPSGAALTSAVVADPAHGTLTLHADGSFTYVPDAGFVGSDSFTYHDSDGTNTSNTATVTLNVTPIAPPVANNDAYSTSEGTTLTVAASGVLANDVSPTGKTLTPAVVANPSHGTLTFHADGSFTYVPNAGFVGSDSFTYDDSDGNNTSNVATVTLNVTPTAPPIANNDSYAAGENTTLTVAAPGVLTNDVSPTGKTLTPSVVTNPAHGTLTFHANGAFSYVPDTGFVGTDSFTYDDSDGNNTSNVATVTINVSPLAPAARDDSYSTPEGATLTINAPGVQSNDVNTAGGTLTSAVVAQPSHGTLTFLANGSFTYVPNTGFAGTDTFTYRDANGGLTSNTATVTIHVTPTAPPVARNDVYATLEGTTLRITGPGVLANDVSPTGRPLSASVIGAPAHGTLSLSPNGALTYTPAANFSGTDSFTYRDFDGENTSNIATVVIHVTPVSVSSPGGDAGPKVVSLVRLGYHSQPTEFVLTFNAALNPSRAQNPANYVLQSVARRPRTFRIASAVYNAANHTVTLFPAKPPIVLRARYQLTVVGAGPNGITDAYGVALDGNGGTGTNDAIVFDQSILAGPSVDPPSPHRHPAQSHRTRPETPAAQRHLSPAAVDHVLASGARLR